MKRITIIIIVFIVSTRLMAQQMSIQFIPQIDGRNMQGLFNAKIINSGTSSYGYLTINVRLNNKERVCEIITPNFNIRSGLSAIPSDIGGRSKIKFANTDYGKLLAKAGIFNTGELTYCYELTLLGVAANDSPVIPIIGSVENCFDYDLVPLSPLTLTFPYDGVKICEKRPVFSWIPSLPVINGSFYKMLCVEVKPEQSATEAINYNLAFINLNQLQVPILPLPSNVKELQTGKKYAWQIIQYTGDIILNKSEIWEFTVGCEEEEEEVVLSKKYKQDSYRLIDDLSEGNLYVVKNEIKIIVNQQGGSSQLNYNILSLNYNDKPLKNLPLINLKNGQNKVIINLEKVKGLVHNQSYILQIIEQNLSIKELRIVYKNEK